MDYANEEFVKSFGKNLARERERQGLSLRKLSEKIWQEFRVGLDRNSIYRIEKGRVNCTILTVQLLAKGLGKHPSDLLSFDKISE